MDGGSPRAAVAMRKERNRGNTWKFSGNAFVEEKLVTEANFTAMMIEN